MGSEDRFHKRKAKTEKDLAREQAKRATYDRVLIVCEGSKTEPNYLRELIDCLELNTANVEIDGKCGSSPISVVTHSKQRYAEEKRKGDAFDRVFCVFDKDTHASYEPALVETSKAKPKNVYQAINSVPCFEYWLLLHFEFTTKPYTTSGAKSICANLIEDLKKYLPDYTKSITGIYQQLTDQTDRAIAWSKTALEQALNNSTDNPTTYIHELVEYLQQLKT